jgi:hypothetical protein
MNRRGRGWEGTGPCRVSPHEFRFTRSAALPGTGMGQGRRGQTLRGVPVPIEHGFACAPVDRDRERPGGWHAAGAPRGAERSEHRGGAA